MTLAGAAAAFLVSAAAAAGPPSATTPIRHLVIIFQENVSFDHYFATYPQAANTDGQHFEARPGTPAVNGLNASLLAPNNPNAVQPFRLSREQAQTCDQDHGYREEQLAFNHGLMDRFVETVGHGEPGCRDYGHGNGLVMGYYDGNTVTALWQYAQHFAMSDNSYGTGFGPSTPGAINLVSGQTHGFSPAGRAVTRDHTIIGDPDPAGDFCSRRGSTTVTDPAARNIGDLLNAKGVTWGWFQGGFRDCEATHSNTGGVVSRDYVPHHEPFQYYPSTANPRHLPPLSVERIGHDDQANHQYDLVDFRAALEAGNLPSVSFLKAPAYQNGHAGYSDPLSEQVFLVETINRLQKSPDWESTAVIISWDDSDGWYDHQMGPIVNHSRDPAVDALDGRTCGSDPKKAAGGFNGRCGYGPRLPLIVISPFARENYVDHSVTDQTSITRFIEDNWNTGRIGNHSMDEKAGSLINLFDFAAGPRGDRLFLDPQSGQPVDQD